MDYHSKAKSLDVRGDDMRDGFEAELSSHGQGDRINRLIVGAFRDTCGDVQETPTRWQRSSLLEIAASLQIRRPKRSKASSSTNSTAPGDILPTADGHGSSSTVAVW